MCYFLLFLHAFLRRPCVFSRALDCGARRGPTGTRRRKFGSRVGSVARALGVRSREIWQVITGCAFRGARDEQDNGKPTRQRWSSLLCGSHGTRAAAHQVCVDHYYACVVIAYACLFCVCYDTCTSLLCGSHVTRAAAHQVCVDHVWTLHMRVCSVCATICVRVSSVCAGLCICVCICAGTSPLSQLLFFCSLCLLCCCCRTMPPVLHRASSSQALYFVAATVQQQLHSKVYVDHFYAYACAMIPANVTCATAAVYSYCTKKIRECVSRSSCWLLHTTQQPMLHASSNISCDCVTCLSPFNRRHPRGFHVTHISQGKASTFFLLSTDDDAVHRRSCS